MAYLLPQAKPRMLGFWYRPQPSQEWWQWTQWWRISRKWPQAFQPSTPWSVPGVERSGGGGQRGRHKSAQGKGGTASSKRQRGTCSGRRHRGPSGTVHAAGWPTGGWQGLKHCEVTLLDASHGCSHDVTPSPKKEDPPPERPPKNSPGEVIRNNWKKRPLKPSPRGVIWNNTPKPKTV